MSVTEDRWTPPPPWCPAPHHWHADTADATEHEVTELAAAFVRALQPEAVVETGTNTGQTALAIGAALARNGHGHLWTVEADPGLARSAAAALAHLPVTVVCADTADWEPPVPPGFAWLDSAIDARAGEIARWAASPGFAPGAVIGIHDTGPQHRTAATLEPLVRSGLLRTVTLRTPRGVTFAEVTR